MQKFKSIAVGLTASLFAAGYATAQSLPSAPEPGKSPIVDQIRTEGVLKVGVIVNAPFILQNPITNTYSGPAADFMIAAAQGVGVKVAWVPVNWNTMIAGLQAKQYQVLATAVYATEARKKVVNFVNYSRSGVCYIARRDNAKVNELSDLKGDGLSIVIPSGASYTDDMKAAYPKLSVTTKQLPPGGGNFYDDVLTGRSDLSAIESLIAPQLIKAQPELKIIPSVDECLAKPDFGSDIGVAINKGDPMFEKYLAEVIENAAPAVDAAVKNQ